jgi:uncharacterized protein involved in exopolysaccharide biosynthesis
MQVHLKDYLDIIRRRKWLVILFFLTVVGLVSFFSIRATPIYRATTQILIENKASQMIQYGDSGPGGSAPQIDYFQTQLNLLRSRQNAYEVIADLELWKLFESPPDEYSTAVDLPAPTPPAGRIPASARPWSTGIWQVCR